MAHRFQFNPKNGGLIVVEGQRVDITGDTVTVIDEQGQPRVSFVASELVVWWQLRDSVSVSD
jgi:hypothetical protein